MRRARCPAAATAEECSVQHHGSHNRGHCLDHQQRKRDQIVSATVAPQSRALLPSTSVYPGSNTSRRRPDLPEGLTLATRKRWSAHTPLEQDIMTNKSPRSSFFWRGSIPPSATKRPEFHGGSEAHAYSHLGIAPLPKQEFVIAEPRDKWLRFTPDGTPPNEHQGVKKKGVSPPHDSRTPVQMDRLTSGPTAAPWPEQHKQVQWTGMEERME